MKALFKNILFIVVVLSTCFLFSCKDDSEDSATPEVSYVRMTSTASSDSLVTQASLGATIAIVGNHLSNVTQLWFNDQEASLNPVYITDHTILVSVPTGIPSAVTNTIRLITSSGVQTSYSFVTKVPNPVITSISCEYANVGDTVTIKGNYFLEPTLKFTNDVAATIISSTQTQIEAIVPDGAEAGPISITSLYGTTASSFKYRDNEDITSTTKFITDFETTDWDSWGYGHYGTTGGIDGQYYLFSGTAGSWNWNTSLALFYVNPNGTPIVTSGEIKDLALRFEVNSTEWHDTPLAMWFSTDVTFSMDDDNAQYHWKPYLQSDGTTANYDTNGWITVTIPLSDFDTNKDESVTRALTSVSQLIYFHMFSFGSMTDSTNSTTMNVKIDNLRIVKYDD
jgi:hypothetical protein